MTMDKYMKVQLSNGIRINRDRDKSPPWNGPYCFQRHGKTCHLVALLYPNEANKPGYEQVFLFSPAEATTK
jgi:hypothetical protein